MASPFSIFRKHQKTLMVILVIGSMVAFTGESLFTAGGANFTLLGAMLGTTLAAIAGFQFKRPVPYAIGGAILGALIGFFGPSLAGQTGLASEVGVFTEERINDLTLNRSLANRFVRECQQRAGLGMGGDAFGFPFNQYRSLMLGEVLRAEADEMGLQISDSQVFQFIDQRTLGKLPPEEFTEARKNVTTVNGKILSEPDLLNVLREQLRAQWAFQALVPFKTNGLPQEVYWDMFRRMNVRQQVASASVSVDNFLDKVGEPNETEIQTYFDQYQNQEPGVEPGMPGFFQPRKIKLAYVEPDQQAVLDSLPEVSEEDIRKKYDETKDIRYKKAVVPEDPTDDDDDEFLMDLDKEDGEPTPPLAPKPGDPVETPGEVETPGAPEATPPAPGAEAKPAEEAKPPKVDEGDAGKEEKSGDCGPWQEEKAEASEAETTAAEPQDGKSSEEQKPLSTPELKLPEGTEIPEDLLKAPPVEYEPLDTALMNLLREEIRRERARDILQKKMEKALVAMKKLEDERSDVALSAESAKDFDGPEIRQKLRELDPQLCRRLKKYADENGLLYVETPLVDFYEFSNAEEYPIAAASDSGGMFNPQGNVMLMRALFGSVGKNPLFDPKLVMSQSNQYAYWVLADIPEHIPRLEEPGVKKQVIKAWQREKARPLAKKRAMELAQKIRDGLEEATTMTDSLKGETEAGTPKSPALLVTKTDNSFSWITSSSAAQLGMRQTPPQLTQIQGIPNVGNDFMNYIFRTLNEGEVGVHPDANLMNYYVVEVMNRFPSEEADEAALRSRFIKEQHSMGSNTGNLANSQIVGPANNEWVKQLEAKYDVKLLVDPQSRR